MRLGPWRRGELLVLLGLVGLVATLFLEWFGFGDIVELPRNDDGVDSGMGIVGSAGQGWGTLGHPWLELLALFGLALVAVLVTALRARPGRPTYGAMVAIVLAIPLGVLTLFTTALRALAFRPTIDLRPGTLHLDPAVGTWIGLAAILVALVGVWVAMADDRTAAPESAEEPPAPRPVPALRPDEPGTTPPAE